VTQTHPNPVAIVTGAGRGIGRAIAIALAREGYSLAIAARSRDELEETRRLTSLPAHRALIVLIDLAERDAAEMLYEATVDCFDRIDVLVNNAGWAPARTSILKIADADTHRILDVNLRTPIALSRLAARRMAEAGAGAIVNIASTAATDSPAGEAVYAAAKAGIVAFTRAAFADLREYGIKVSVIIPGLVDTALIPASKRLDRSMMLAPDDVASAVVAIVKSPAHSCPLELVLHPQRAPERKR